MSEENVETVRQGYEPFNRGDVEWMIARLDPEIVWEDPVEVPGSSSYRGTREVRAYLESFAQQWEEIRFEPEGILDAGERVVALVRMVARGRASGAQVDARLAHLYDLREGGGMRVLRVRTFLPREGPRSRRGCRSRRCRKRMWRSCGVRAKRGNVAVSTPCWSFSIRGSSGGSGPTCLSPGRIEAMRG